MARTIVALVGRIGSGKGAAASYLHSRYGASVYRFSTILRDVMKRLYIPEERERIATMSNVLREGFGQELFAEVMARDIAADHRDFIVLDGVRRLADIAPLRALPEFVLVHIDASEDVRLGRLRGRKENLDDAGKTLPQFQANEALETERSIDEVIPHAQIRIENNGTYEDFCAALDAALSPYGHTH